MTATATHRIPVGSVPAVWIFQGQSQNVRLVADSGKVNMVGHQDERMDIDGVLVERLYQIAHEHLPIGVVVFPGSGGVARQIEQADPRLGGESIAEVFRSVGGQIRQSWCGPCFGQGPDALKPGERAITSFNRNWQNRMGVGGEGYLASPAVVAASALVGYMAPPSELGLEWNPEEFGV